MKKPWCIVPFIHMYASDPEWDDKVCCVASNKLTEWKNNSEHWLEEKWTGDYMVDLRKRMLDENSDLPECSECISIEKNGGTNSERIQFNRRYEDLGTSIQFNVETGNQYNKPIDFDIRPGNLCNLQCRMCGPTSSSQLNKEQQNNEIMKEMHGSKGSWEKSLTAKDGNNWGSDSNINFIKSSLPHTKRIKFLGGEPTIMPDVLDLLDTMNKLEIYETLSQLHFTTNATNLDKKFYSKLENYKDLDVNISIDGIGETVEYIRHPLNFEKFKENYQFIRQYDNVRTVFNCAIQALNIHNILDFCKWTIDANPDFLNFVLVYFPIESSMSALPDEYKNYHCDYILNDDIMKHDIIKNSGLEQCILRTKDTKFDEFSYNQLIRQTVVFDNTRNQHIRDYIPELWEVIKNDYKLLQRDFKMKTNHSNLRSEWVLDEKN